MFSFLRKDAPTLQLYGKLPLAKDYLRVGCGEGGARALREWLDQAFSTAVDGGAPPILAYPMRFLIGERWAPAPVQGCAWPSSDAGGLRPFPLVLLVERRKRAILEELEAGLAPAEAWWRKLEESFPPLSGYADGQALLGAMRGRAIEPEPAPEEAERVDFESWISALWPGEGRAGLARALATLRRSKDAPARLPLVSDLPIAPQVHAWWKTLEAVGSIRAGDAPTLFFPQPGATGDEPAFVVAFPRAPGPRDARWLVSARGRDGAGDSDLCSGEARVAGSAAAAPESIPPLADSLRGALMTL